MAETNDNMRIVIYGAGAVGGMVGGLLALSGTPVLLIGRPGNVNAIRRTWTPDCHPGRNSHSPVASGYHAKPNKAD